MDNCVTVLGDRRRVFWATQPSCGVRDCGCVKCAIPGLVITQEQDCGPCTCCGSPACPNETIPSTIDNSNWVRGLALNILLTDGAKEDCECGHRPGERGGHWSDAYHDGSSAGSLVRAIPRTTTIQESVNLVRTYAISALNKLVEYGVATSVDVVTEYIGDGVIALNATIFGQSGETSNVGVTAERLQNSWVWRS